MKDTKAVMEASKEVEEGSPTTDAWSKDAADVRQVAVRVVDDVLSRAAEQADVGRPKDPKGQTANIPAIKTDDDEQDDDLSSELDEEDNEFPDAPTIQIDLVGSRTPSPEEEESIIQFPTYASKRKNRENAASNNKVPQTPSPVEDTASLREFLVGYVQEMIKKAVPLAEEKLTAKVETMDVEALPVGCGSKGRRGPWHARFRAAFTSFMQALCICGERRDDPCS